MSQPFHDAFPEYRASDLTADARAHLLGALDYGKAAHQALLLADRRGALTKLDMMILLAQEARKPLLIGTPEPTIPSPRKDEEPGLLWQLRKHAAQMRSQSRAFIIEPMRIRPVLAGFSANLAPDRARLHKSLTFGLIYDLSP